MTYRKKLKKKLGKTYPIKPFKGTGEQELPEGLEKTTNLASLVFPDYIEVDYTYKAKRLTYRQKKIIEEASLYGASDKEILMVACVTKEQFDSEKSNDIAWAARLRQLQGNNSFLVKRNLTEAIQDGNIAVSMWFAETKMKEEFSKKVTVDNNHELQVTVNTYDETKEAIEGKLIETNKNELLTYE